MKDDFLRSDEAQRRIVIVTGMSGAGKKSALSAFEDIGFTTTDNCPVATVPHILAATGEMSHAIGIDVRTHGFSEESFIGLCATLEADKRNAVDVVFLDCDDHILTKRFSETRRSHPRSGKSIGDLLREEREQMVSIQELATLRIDTTETSVMDLSLMLHRHFANGEHGPLFEFMSFGFKHGAPRNATMTHDLRSLPNPHWDPVLRAKTGQDADVVSYIMDKPEAQAFVQPLVSLVDVYMAAVTREGRPFVSIGIGCTGGQHRSVAVTEHLARHAEEAGYQVVVTHRDLEKRGLARPYQSVLRPAADVAKCG